MTNDILVTGVDASFTEITPENAAYLVNDQQVRVFMQCLWTGAEAPRTRVPNLRNMAAAGAVIGGYISVSPHMTGDKHVEAAVDGFPNDLWQQLVKTPIDVELEGLTYNQHVLPALTKAISLGKPGDIYANYNTWVNILGNPILPPDVGGWNAFWDDDPDFDFAHYPWGGLTLDRIWGEQYSGAIRLGDDEVDQDIFKLNMLVPNQPPPPNVVLPDYRDHAAACASINHFLRNGFDYRQLSQADVDTYYAMVEVLKAARQ